MKKFLAITLLLCMMLVMGAWSANGEEYTLGMGVVTSMDSSATNNAQVDATVAAVILDKDGKIVDCRIDCAQSKMDVTDGEVDAAKEFLSKVELKEDYNMVKYSNATLEWYQQAENFEKYALMKLCMLLSPFPLLTCSRLLPRHVLMIRLLLSRQTASLPSVWHATRRLTSLLLLLPMLTALLKCTPNLPL